MKGRLGLGLIGLAGAAILAAGVLSSSPAAAGEGLALGSKAPGFVVRSGDNQELTLRALAGKVVVLFYEDKDVTERTAALKKELDQFIDNHPAGKAGRLVRVTILDGSEASWLTRSFWQAKLKKASQEHGRTLYADWDGSLKKAYQLKDEDNNLLVLDGQGDIRLCRAGWGQGLAGGEVIDLLKKLLAD